MTFYHPPKEPNLEVAFFTGDVRALGMRIELPAKEVELLFTVASSQNAIGADELVDALWPEASGDAAQNAFRVCLHRLRRHVGDPRVIRRVGKAYALHPGAVADLWSLQDAIVACERSDHRDALRSKPAGR